MTRAAVNSSAPALSGVSVSGRRCTITLTVTEAGQLFASSLALPPEYVEPVPELLDFLMDAVKENAWQCAHFELRLRMPAAERERFAAVVGPSPEKALSLYFDGRIRRLERQLREHFADCGRMLAYGLAFMLFCTVVRTYLAPEESITLMSSFREGLLVIGWVALWRPIEETLFNWWPIAREKRRCEVLRKMSVKFETV